MPMGHTTIIRDPYLISGSTIQPYSIRVTLSLRIGQLLYANVLFNICREHISGLFGSHV